MATTNVHVVGIGNAIVDIISQCDDSFLVRHAVAKGSMRLIDTPTVNALYKDMGPSRQISGGSAANTMVGVASLGGKSAFIGKVADDEFGHSFGNDLRAAGVTFKTAADKGGEPTARSLILVTPDGERTMNTFLGISPELDHGAIDAELIASAGIVYLEGYLFDRPDAKAAFRQAATIAAKAGRKVSLTLSDAFCVDRHRDEFLDLVCNHVDILFANEAEITSLYQTSDFATAARAAARDTKLAVLTRSAKGAEIKSGTQTVTVSAYPVAKVVDTTGAGDLFAAGFLFGVATGRDLETSGRLGALAASEIISHVGARPATSLAALAKAQGLL
jgi:sugar/nucleoside kinase (ribokinase family)